MKTAPALALLVLPDLKPDDGIVLRYNQGGDKRVEVNFLASEAATAQEWAEDMILKGRTHVSLTVHSYRHQRRKGSRVRPSVCAV